jgi:hypothetical protein
MGSCHDYFYLAEAARILAQREPMSTAKTGSLPQGGANHPVQIMAQEKNQAKSTATESDHVSLF